jgi:hypothetical protein
VPQSGSHAFLTVNAAWRSSGVGDQAAKAIGAAFMSSNIVEPGTSLALPVMHTKKSLQGESNAKEYAASANGHA